MNTLQVVRRFVFSQWGGTETVVWNTSKQLNKMGHQAEILATEALQNKANEVEADIPIKRFAYIYPYLNMNAQKKLALDRKGGDPYSHQLYSYLLHKKDVDIIHCHSMNRMAAMVRRAARKRNIPYLVSFHGGYFDVPKQELEQMVLPYKNTFNYGKFFDILCRKKRYLEDADAIICVGYNEYELSKQKYPQKLVYYLPNGVDYQKFSKKAESSFKEKYKIPANRKTILCLSRIDYQKNQEILLKLLTKINKTEANAHLVLIGPVTSSRYYQKLQKIIEVNKLENTITIIKGLHFEDPDLISAYQQADMFILPSIHEPFGIVVLEAWASGIPVIASQVGGLARLVQHRQNGLFFDGSLEDLYKKYKELVENNKLRDKLVKNALQEVRTKYSWQAITKQLIGYYQEIIAKYRSKKL